LGKKVVDMRIVATEMHSLVPASRVFGYDRGRRVSRPTF